MNISRHGTSANYGLSSITLDNPAVSWDGVKKVIRVDKKSIKDFNTSSHHNYILTFSLKEVVTVFAAIANAASKNPEDLAEMHPEVLKSLLLIQAAIVGYAPTKHSC